MNPLDWLNGKVPEFVSLSDKEREVILHFSLLWSLFESKALETNASSNKIVTLSQQWQRDGLINPERFASNLDYFRNRYFKNGNATEYFAGLNLRANDHPQLVESVLQGNDAKPGDTVAALLIIAFRLRNNLFHGVKWAYGIRGQFNNFINANDVLMAALELV